MTSTEMTLGDLPIEILRIVINFVGISQLRKQETCGLIVCKWWCNLTRPILLNDLAISGNMLIHLPEQAYNGLVLFTRRITIEINGLEGWSDKDNTQGTDSDLQWNESLVDHLNCINVLLSRCHLLGSFTLRAHRHIDPTAPLAPRLEYLSAYSPANLIYTLQTSNISELVIDIYGSHLNRSMDAHSCARGILQIPSLRSVRLRMRMLCPLIFGFHDADVFASSKIETLVINLSVKETGLVSPTYSRHCIKPPSFRYMHADMVTAAAAWMKKALHLRLFRIMWHEPSSLEVVAMDCLTGSKWVVPDEGEWNWTDGEEPCRYAEVSDPEFGLNFSDDGSEDDDYGDDSS